MGGWGGWGGVGGGGGRIPPTIIKKMSNSIHFSAEKAVYEA
ncbi:hypothetical protein [Okeania sp. SIO3I5]|nr:hypothetical protein [Okeania sp. SIO3I5]